MITLLWKGDILYIRRNANMFAQRLREQFNINEPIFTEEIMRLFPEYSRMQVFRFINKAEGE